MEHTVHESVRFYSRDKLMCNVNDIGNLVLLRNL
jgi:hypothetical protein